MASGISFSQFSISKDPLQEVQDSKQNMISLANKAQKLIKFSFDQVRLLDEIVMDPNIESLPFFFSSSMGIKGNLFKLIQNINELVEKIIFFNEVLSQIEKKIYSSDNVCFILCYKNRIDHINIKSCFIEDKLISLDCALLVTTMTTIDLLTPVAKDRFNEITMLENFELRSI
ncbi:MAG: hypothetical protein KR126chlam6_01116 [Candidatus Anoxychlamydiales bacterium]|nr:hypothetical protein [Candidatus Anoxychlamydiales bacterium]